MAADYIFEPIETDPDALLQDAVDEIQKVYSDWEPSQAQLDFIMLRIWSLKEAQIADMSTRVLRAIYRYFGSTIVNIQPLPGSYAEVSSTWFATDTESDGRPRVIPQDTLVGIRDDVTNDLVFFNVADQDYSIPEGSNFINGVVLRAQDEGASQNELSGPLEIVEQLDWLQEARTDGVSTNGADPESDEAYIGRLTDNFSLLSPRPVLAPDYATMARNVAGVQRSNARDNFIPGTNEIQRLVHTATGGTLTLVRGAEVSDVLPWNATLEQISDALLPMPAFERGDFVLTGGPFPNPVFIEYIGNRRASDQPQLSIDPTNLTGPAVTHTETTTQVSSADQDGVEDAVTVVGVDVNGNTLGASKRQELLSYLRSLRPQNFITNIADPTYTTVDVTATIVPRFGFDANAAIGAAMDAINLFTAPYSWGIPAAPEPNDRAWENRDTVRTQELYTILNNVEQIEYVSALTFGLNGGAQDAADKVIPGIFPLTRPGDINITV